MDKETISTTIHGTTWAAREGRAARWGMALDSRHRRGGNLQVNEAGLPAGTPVGEDEAPVRSLSYLGVAAWMV
jgi:hypothetical protein